MRLDVVFGDFAVTKSEGPEVCVVVVTYDIKMKGFERDAMTDNEDFGVFGVFGFDTVEKLFRPRKEGFNWLDAVLVDVCSAV